MILMTDLKYPVLFVHGMGFRDRKRICYWGRIPRRLRAEGVRVFFGCQDANGSVEDNALFLAERIGKLAEENSIERFNVIAHSKGGLEMRRAITHLGADRYVASLTTIATPHHGSFTMDRLMKLPGSLIRTGCAAADLRFRITGDKKPNTYEAISAFTTESAERFNRDTPDAAGVYYQSYAFVCKNCSGDVFMMPQHVVVKHFDGENDGLVSAGSAEWGDFRGVFKSNSNRGISHCDEVDMRRRRFTARTGQGISDITDFYVEVIKELARKGF